VLLESASPLVAGRVAEALGRDASNIAGLLKGLVGDGLVTVQLPERRERVGRPPKDAYALSPQGEAELIKAIQPSVGKLADGDHIVLADASVASLPELLHLLADAECAARGAWSFLLTGMGREQAVAFRGRHAASDAADLLSVLAGARIRSRHVIVTDLQSATDLRADARRRAREAQRAQLASDTRRATTGR
jgi:hypothetical protein